MLFKTPQTRKGTFKWGFTDDTRDSVFDFGQAEICILHCSIVAYTHTVTSQSKRLLNICSDISVLKHTHHKLLEHGPMKIHCQNSEDIRKLRNYMSQESRVIKNNVTTLVGITNQYIIWVKADSMSETHTWPTCVTKDLWPWALGKTKYVCSAKGI